MNQLNKNKVNIAVDVPPVIESALKNIDGTKISSSKVNTLLAQAESLLNSVQKYGYKTFDIAKILPKRTEYKTKEIEVYSISQSIIDVFNNVDWTVAKSETNAVERAGFNKIVKDFINNNFPIVKR